MVLGNGGAIDVLGGAGQTTRAVLLVDTTGLGTINGNGAAPGATTLTVDGYLQNQEVVLTDGTVTINDTSFALSEPWIAGFDVTGGSFTFGDASGVLVLHQAALTTLAFNVTDTGEVQTPDGRTSLTTSIHGFGQGEVIDLPGKDLTGFGFASYDTSLSPLRQMVLLCLLDDLHRDGCAQELVATHSPILMAHPGADLLWIDGDGITRRTLGDIPHWQNMHRFMADPKAALGRLLAWRWL